MSILGKMRQNDFYLPFCRAIQGFGCKSVVLRKRVFWILPNRKKLNYLHMSFCGDFPRVFWFRVSINQRVWLISSADRVAAYRSMNMEMPAKQLKKRKMMSQTPFLSLFISGREVGHLSVAPGDWIVVRPSAGKSLADSFVAIVRKV